MELINELITPFNENKEIDVDVFNKLIEISISKGNNYQLLFSYLGDGYLITQEEKIALIKSINSSYLNRIIYFFQLSNEYNDKKEINFLLSSNIEYVMINPPTNCFYSQNGLFLYIKNILKKLKNKKIMLMNSPLNCSINFHFQTLKKLIKTNNNIIALYENGFDKSLICLLKHHFPTIKIYVNESKLNYALNNFLDGIVSVSSFIFIDDYLTVFDDYQNDYTNTLLIDYLLFVHEILCFSNNSTIIKAYLKKLGYSSMNVRLPLVIEQNDIENLDYLI